MRGRVGGGHQRLRRVQPGPRDRGRRALLGQHRHDRLAGAELGEHLLQVVRRVRERRRGRLERLGVVRGVGAQRVLDPVAELGEHVGVDVLRRLRDEEDADALGPDQPHRLGDRLQERLGRVLEEQVRLVEEEHELRLVEVADLGQVLEEVGEQPHEEGGEQRGLLRRRRAAPGWSTMPRPSGVGAQEIGAVELGFAEEVVGAGVGERDQLAQQHTRGDLRQAAEALAAASEPSSEIRYWMTERRSLMSSSGRPFLSAKWKTRFERRGLYVGQVQHLGQQDRAEGGDGGPHRDAGALAAEGVELHRVRRRLPVLPDRGGPGGELLAGLGRRRPCRTRRP